jgi:hypothetical protein
MARRIIGVLRRGLAAQAWGALPALGGPVKRAGAAEPRTGG